MADATKTLNNILSIIERDTLRIQEISNELKLEPQDALTLTRYASVLDQIVKSSEKEKEKIKNQFKAMNTDDLIAEFKKESKSEIP